MQRESKLLSTQLDAYIGIGPLTSIISGTAQDLILVMNLVLMTVLPLSLSNGPA